MAGEEDGHKSDLLVAHELEESNRRIAELLQALEEEKKRVARAEEALILVSKFEQTPQHKNSFDDFHPSSSTLQTVSPEKADIKHSSVGSWSIRSLPSVTTWWIYRPLGDGGGSEVGGGGKARMESLSHICALGPETAEDDLALSDLDLNTEEVQQLRDHDSHVWCCAFHPEVTLLVTASSDKTVRLWRTDGECMRVMRGHKEWVYCVAFSPAGDTVVSGSFDGTLRLWTVSSGECFRVIRREGVCFYAVAFQPGQGAYIAAASSEKAVRLFRVSDGECARTFTGHTNTVSCVAFQPPAGRRMVTGSVDGTVRVWTVADGKCVSVLGERSKDKIWCCAMDPSGCLVVAGGADQVLRVWKVHDGTVAFTLQGHKGVVRCVAFNPRVPGMIASGEGNLTWGSDNSVRLWYIRKGGHSECKSILLGHTKMTTGVAFSPDGSLLATASRDCTCRLWSIGMSQPGELHNQSAPLHSLSNSASTPEAHHPQPHSGLKSELTLDSAAQKVPGENRHAGAQEHGKHGHAESPNLEAHVGSRDGTGEREDDTGTAREGSALSHHKEILLGSATAAGKVAGKIKIVTAKVAKKLPRVDMLWKGSLFSEEELQQIKRKRENMKSDAEKAEELYWKMYNSRAKVAAGAFAEAFAEAGAETPGQQGVETHEEGTGEEADPAHKIVQELKELQQGLRVEEAENAQSEGDGQDGFIKSAELVAIEEALIKQREEKRIFEERLKEEREALDKLTEELEGSDTAQMTSEDIRRLVKTATYSGYKLAELKRERDELMGEGKLMELRDQRAKFEKYAAAKRDELRAQADKVADLLDQMQQRRAWETSFNTPAHVSHRGLDVDEEEAQDNAFYKPPAPSGLCLVSSEEGVLLLQSMSLGTQALVLRMLSHNPYRHGRESEARSALALALNALELDKGRLWDGPWRHYTASQLDLCRGSSGESGEGLEEMELIAQSCGVDVMGLRASESDEATLRHHLIGALSPVSEAHEDGGIMLVGFAQGQGTDEETALWACVVAYCDDQDACLCIAPDSTRVPPRWLRVSELWNRVKGLQGATDSGMGCYIAIRASQKGTSLLAVPLCLRPHPPNPAAPPPLQDIISLLQGITRSAIKESRDPSAVLQALVSTAMVRGRLAPVLRQYEVILAPGGLDARHSDAIAQLLADTRSSNLYLRIEVVLQDQLVRSGVGSWRASRTSAMLLTFLIAACDETELFGELPAGLKKEMYSLHAGARSVSALVHREAEILQAHVQAAAREFMA